MAFKSKEVIPYYDSVWDYVNSLPYDCPLDEFDGYIYKSPLNPISKQYGIPADIVYKRLFKEETYMIVSKEELQLMRTTIQYSPLALNDMHKKLCNFVKQCGFKYISRRSSPWRWNHNVKFITTSFIRDNIRVVLSSNLDAQEYIPNSIPILYLDKVSKNPQTNRLYTIEKLSAFDWIPIEDELCEKSIESFENYIKSKLNK